MKPAASVIDPFSAASDPALAPLALALDPRLAEEQIKRRLLSPWGNSAKVRLKAIRVTRYKPGRRCVVEYDIRINSSDGIQRKLIMIGKIRARRSGNEGYRLLKQIWDAGFQDDSADGISVPQPLGVISRFHMWFQMKVRGHLAGALLYGPGGPRLARRIAEAIHKLHRSKISTKRVHLIADELRILDQCLMKAAVLEPQWKERLMRVGAACKRLGQTLPQAKLCGIHRDFYPAQVLVHRDRINLIDFDLYCLGDAALDIGNFIGHMAEESLRQSANLEAAETSACALRNRYLELEGEGCQASIEVYTTLTLARHIFLSMTFPERRPFTELLLRSCEQKLGIAR